MRKAIFVMAFCFFSGFLLKTLFFNSSTKNFGKEEKTEAQMDPQNGVAADSAIAYDDYAEISEPSEEVGPNDVQAITTEPRALNMEEFRAAVGYPGIERELGIEGEVIVRVRIDKRGKYLNHIVLQNPDATLTNAVERKLPMLKFTPALEDGAPVICWVTVPVDFRLRD